MLAWIAMALLTKFSHADIVKFRYVPAEMPATECTHKRIRDLPDWTVRCGEKTFTAHVIVRIHKRDFEPKTALEILYWVTEPSQRRGKPATFHSSSFWIRLKGEASSHSMVLAQGIENDYASLDMEWTNLSVSR